MFYQVCSIRSQLGKASGVIPSYGVALKALMALMVLLDALNLSDKNSFFVGRSIGDFALCVNGKGGP